MTQIRTVDDIKHLGTILCVWAHPDDESFCGGGITAAAIQNKQLLICVTATKGEAGVKDENRWPAARLGEIRAKEMNQALKHLGCTHHSWLGYADGGCADVPPDQAVKQISRLIDEYRPNSILTFGPDGLTGHPDHQTVSQWAQVAAGRSMLPITTYHVVQLQETYKHMRQADEQFNIFFNINKPPLISAADCDILFHLPEELLDKKYQALLAQPSQTEALLNRFSKEFIDGMFSTEAFVKFR